MSPVGYFISKRTIDGVARITKTAVTMARARLALPALEHRLPEEARRALVAVVALERIFVNHAVQQRNTNLVALGAVMADVAALIAGRRLTGLRVAAVESRTCALLAGGLHTRV